MKKIFVFALILLLSITGCKKDEDEKLPIEGKWTLISFTQGDYAEIYDEGEIIWKFNKYKEIIVEINTDLTDSELPITEAGVYKYVAAEKAVSIEDVQYAVSVENGFLTLDHNSASGGTQIKFVSIDNDK